MGGSKRIHFHTIDVSPPLSEVSPIKRWVQQVIKEYNFQLKELNYIFCSDEHLYQLNKTYLNHHTYTDIITFDNSETLQIIEADIFISTERVQENAGEHKVTFQQELRRVLIHGILHLLGYQDNTPTSRETMRQQENKCLNILQQIEGS